MDKRSYHEGYRDGLKDSGPDARLNAGLVIVLSVLLALAAIAMIVSKAPHFLAVDKRPGDA